MNNVSLIGNLATEVEVRDLGDDKKVAGFLLAVNRGAREAGADFVWVRRGLAAVVGRWREVAFLHGFRGLYYVGKPIRSPTFRYGLGTR